MAVEIKYVVVRKGEEKMTFANKKEADAYDKMLDMAEVFTDWLDTSPLSMEEAQREVLGLFLAENKEAVQHILRTSKMPDDAPVTAQATQSETAEAPADDVSAESEVAEEPDAPKAAKSSKSAARADKAA